MEKQKEEQKYAFISQPMKDLPEYEIKLARKKGEKKLKELGYKVIDTYFGEEFEKDDAPNKGVLYLGKSLMYLAKCEIAYFCKGWEDARGCKIEHEVAKEYDIEIIYEE